MTENRQDKTLNSFDLQSMAWSKLRAHMNNRLHELRVKNDSDMDAVATAKVRGEIKNLKNLLALESKPDPITVADDAIGE